MQLSLPYDGSEYKTDLSNKLKIAYVCGDNAGPSWHEMYVPTKYMNQTGKVYAEMFFAQAGYDPNELFNFDIVVLQRAIEPNALKLIQRLHENGIRCIFHFTDNLWELPPHNPAKSVYIPERLRTMERNIEACDMVTCTTPFLKFIAEKYNEYVRRPWELVETNEFQKLLPPPRREDDDEIRIGWVLTPHHEDDVYVICNSLGHVARKHKNVKMIFFGHFNNTLAEAIPKTQAEAYMGVPVWDYYAAACSLDLDIGIAPIIAHPFNQGKSRRKWFEYSAAKVATICSDYVTYSIGMTHLENCYKVKKNKPYKWTQGLEYLIEHEDERKKIAQNAFDHVHNYHNPEKYIYKWIDMYNRLMERPIKEG